jgi:hypothetical protein
MFLNTTLIIDMHSLLFPVSHSEHFTEYFNQFYNMIRLNSLFPISHSERVLSETDLVLFIPMFLLSEKILRK